ncbi:MAG: hypothetical protein HUU45_08440, partial [Leptospiraceae bacterium]|nr:hypothetical protein [Leptospiraceae bacterium]
KQNIEDLNCEIQSKIILFKLRAKSGADTLLEIWSAQQKKELFEEVFDLKAGFVIV